MNISRIASAHDIILVVGNIAKWQAELWHIPTEPALRYASFEKLDSDLLAWVEPSIIVVPLITEQFDALDVLERLSELNYQGKFLAVSKPLPSVSMVQEEFIRRAPEIDAGVVIVPEPEGPS